MNMIELLLGDPRELDANTNSHANPLSIERAGPIAASLAPPRFGHTLKEHEGLGLVTVI